MVEPVSHGERVAQTVGADNWPSAGWSSITVRQLAKLSY